MCMKKNYKCSIYSPIDAKIIILRVHLKYKFSKITVLFLPKICPRIDYSYECI